MSESGFGSVLLISSLLVFACNMRTKAADRSAVSASASPAEQYQGLVREYETAQQDFSKAYSAAKTDQERERLSEKYPQPQAWSPRLLELAQKHPRDPAAVDALIWIVANDRYGEIQNDALGILLRDHVADQKLDKVAQALVYSNAKEPDKALGAIIKDNPHREVQAQATFSLGLVKSRQDKNTEAEKLFEQVIEKFGDVQSYRGTLADAARGQLFEMHNLIIGKVAPDIEGQDVDGRKFRLSDYRGKVVVIDFWGDW